MKAAAIFLLVALSCCFDIPAASKGKHTYPAPELISRDCIKELLKSSLPDTLLRLQEMLCCFSQAKKTNNAELYRKFLLQFHQLLIDTGCTGDQVLKIEDCLEKVGDQLGDACHKIVLQILTCVEELEITEKVLNTLCKLAGKVLLKLSEALKGLDLPDLTNQLGIGGKGKGKGKGGLLGILN
ncbi:unnamed protein product [Staurois parvus]|uniref:Uncharacterized protein n=1 Tax=Staurois parvus TaxID=386267 RepID=A0ABN9FN94_9NEOB|nr:unnamed protein product [Staurois parvus]